MHGVVDWFTKYLYWFVYIVFPQTFWLSNPIIENFSTYYYNVSAPIISFVSVYLNNSNIGFEFAVSVIVLTYTPNSGYVFYKYQSNSISGYSGTNPNPTIIMSNFLQ